LRKRERCLDKEKDEREREGKEIENVGGNQVKTKRERVRAYQVNACQ
jgi:hypothetical protein